MGIRTRIEHRTRHVTQIKRIVKSKAFRIVERLQHRLITTRSIGHGGQWRNLISMQFIAHKRRWEDRTYSMGAR